MKEVEVLRQGKTLIYPTDTIWGIGCDARNEKAIDKVKEIKGRDDTKSFILLVKDLDMLKNYVEKVPEIAINLINTIKTPLTIIYPQAKNLPITHLSFNSSIGIRIPKDDFLQKIFKEFPFPIVSSSANFSKEPSPKSFNDINKELLTKVDYVSLFKREENAKTIGSSIYLLLNDKEYKQIR
jgi:L-threonylcarbamoyladenylate synthase